MNLHVLGKILDSHLDDITWNYQHLFKQMMVQNYTLKTWT